MKRTSIRIGVAGLVAVLSVLGLGHTPADAKTAHHQFSRTICCEG
jgi:hypothetical protein